MVCGLKSTTHHSPMREGKKGRHYTVGDKYSTRDKAKLPRCFHIVNLSVLMLNEHF